MGASLESFRGHVCHSFVIVPVRFEPPLER